MALSQAFVGWPTILAQLLERRDLGAELAESAITEILNGVATPSQMTAFIVALRAKGETTEELEGMLRAVRAAGSRVHLEPALAASTIDIVGTGGDKSNSVNVSTMSALVVAGAGAPVCKHGNRAASSKCGAADLLEAAGVAIELDPAGVQASVEEAGFGFCLAARFHPAFRYTAPSRREIGVPTAFNLLGPMANPAPISNMLVGVAMPNMMDRMADALASRGVTSAWVVHGHGGLDELSLSGDCPVVSIEHGIVSEFVLNAKDFGLQPADVTAVRGGDPAHNAQVIRDTFNGTRGAVRDIVVFNAAAGLVVAGVALHMADGIERAQASIDSGAANNVVDALIKISNSVAK
jgi:anthranilate phosphoribosyltransferase